MVFVCLKALRLVRRALALLCVLAAIFPSRAQTTSSVTVAGRMELPAILESSGLAPSKRYPGTLWTHNDTGSSAFLFGVTTNGARLGEFEVQDVRLIDWEALDVDEVGNIYISDTGTNGLERSHSAVHRGPEPDPSRNWGPIHIEHTWLIRFPTEVRPDCESFFVHGGFGYLITKYPVNGVVDLYRFPLSAPHMESILAERAGSIPVNAHVSDAALSDDNDRLALVTDRGVHVLFIGGDPTTAGSAPRQFMRYNNNQMEGGAWVGGTVYVTAEGTLEILAFNSSLFTGAPVFTAPLQNQFAFVGGSALFQANASAFPAATFTWLFNGAVLPGRTSPRLSLGNLTLEDSGVYELIASNIHGVARSSATLTVTEQQNLVRITEVMSSPALGSGPVADWWELTSFDTNVIDLSGWRFNDGVGDLTDAFVIPNGTTIRPGEIVIFVEQLTADDFRRWWGSTNIPAGTRILSYSGASLSFRATGDTLRLWAADALDANDLEARADFGQADPGVTFVYDPVTGEFPVKSQLGVHGAFRAATGPDIGSPGRLQGGSPPSFTTPLTDQFAAAGGSLILSAEAAGVPAPSFEWRFDGVVIPGETSPQLTLSNLSPANSGLYELIASNENGVAVTSATVTVVEQTVDVRITEVMSSQAIGAALTADWWELTSFDTEVVDLSGWRFNDSTGDLTDAFVVPPGTSLQPGETIIFVETLSAEEFRAWWGAANLAPELQILTYTGAELSFASTGDTLRLWAPGAASTNDVAARVEFGPADVGVSFAYDLATQQFGVKSQAGVNGAFTAATGPDVGSPGRVLGGQPRFTLPVGDQAVEVGGSATFRATVVGSPQPSLQWFFNGAPIAGATSSTLTINNATLAQAGAYELLATNPLGEARSSGTLSVVEDPPQVRVTEVMSSEAPSAVTTEDWWELTSFDDDVIDLSGWRFNDSTGDLTDAFIIPQGVSIRPGESIVFVENLDAAQFLAWWGAANVPAGAQIITYTGSQLSFSATSDSLRIWDATATQANQLLTRIDFGRADPGVSFIYDAATGQFGLKSQLGVNGAIQAATTSDVGSPGRFGSGSGQAQGLELDALVEGKAMVIRFAAEAGRTYTLEASGAPAGGWQTTGESITAPASGMQRFTRTEQGRSRFYRVRVQ